MSTFLLDGYDPQGFYCELLRSADNALLHDRLADLYHEQKILRDGVIPADLVLGNSNFRPVMRGLAVRHKAYVNICGIDIIRDRDGTFRVLEDNARTPSGVSYVIENRHTMLR